jgi:hypothetical protein
MSNNYYFRKTSILIAIIYKWQIAKAGQLENSDLIAEKLVNIWDLKIVQQNPNFIYYILDFGICSRMI